MPWFTHADWLGTERARTNVLASLCEALYSQPYGDALSKGGPEGASCDPTPNFFTGKQRDAESNLDDFGARYFSSQWGHWMSPDWASSAEAVPYAKFDNPQSFNLYAYVGNDPIDGEDPDGHNKFYEGGTTDDDYQAAMSALSSGVQQTPASSAQEGAMMGVEEEMGLPPMTTLGSDTSQQIASQITQFVQFETPIVTSVIQDDAKAISGALGGLLDMVQSTSPMSLSSGNSADQAGTSAADTGKSAPTTKPSLTDHKTALKEVHDKVGKQPKGNAGKFGSPQAGTARKGYRLDPGHPGAKNPAEGGPHINYWDYTSGKNSSGTGVKGAVPIGGTP